MARKIQNQKKKAAMNVVAQAAAAGAMKKYAAKRSKGKGKMKSNSYASQGADIGKMFGRLAGSLADTIFGSGDYVTGSTPVKNSLFDSGVPMMHRNSEDIRISRREFVSDVTTQTGFVVNQYPIQPGLQNLFPYLSGIAQNFQEYSIEGLAFEFRTTSGDSVASTNQAQGTVAMAVVYDFDQTVPNSKQAFLNIGGGIDAKPSRNILCGLECDRSQSPLKTLYLRSGPIPASSAQETHDFGLFCLGTGGAQASFTCGELWITYDIILRKPIPVALNNAQTAASSAKFSTINPTGAHPIAGAVTSNILPKQPTTLNSFVVAAGAAGDILVLVAPPNGTYDCKVNWSSTGSVTSQVNAPTFSINSNPSSPALTIGSTNAWANGSSPFNLVCPQNGATAVANISEWFRFQVSGSNGNPTDQVAITFPGSGTIGTTSAFCDLEVTYLGPLGTTV
jgi:hypothetical protein